MAKQQLMKIIEQGFLFFVIFHFAFGEDATGKPLRGLASSYPVATQELELENWQVLTAQPWHFMVYEKTLFGPKRLCFGIPIHWTLILTTASCLNGRSTENLFVAYQVVDEEDPETTILEYCKVMNVTEHPFFDSKEKSYDAAVLKIDFALIDWTKLEPESVILKKPNEDVEVGTKAEVYVWASPSYSGIADFRVYEFGLELVNYEECKESRMELEKVGTHLYAKTQIPPVLGHQLEESRGSGVVQNNSLIGLISDYVKDPVGNVVCLILTNVKSIKIKDFVHWGGVTTAQSGEHTTDLTATAIESATNEGKALSNSIEAQIKLAFEEDLQKYTSATDEITTSQPLECDEYSATLPEKISYGINSGVDPAFQKDVMTTESGEQTTIHSVASIEIESASREEKKLSHDINPQEKFAFEQNLQKYQSVVESIPTSQPVQRDGSMAQVTEKLSYDINSRADLAFQKNMIANQSGEHTIRHPVSDIESAPDMEEKLSHDTKPKTDPSSEKIVMTNQSGKYTTNHTVEGNASTLLNSQSLITRGWQFMVARKAPNGKIPLCFGTSIDWNVIVTTASCVDGIDAKNLFVTLEAIDSKLRKTKVVGYLTVKKVTLHPLFNDETKFHDTAVLEIDQQSLNPTNIQSKLTTNTKKEKVKLGTKAKGFLWAQYANKELRVCEFELELISYEEFEKMTSKWEKTKTHLYARTYISKKAASPIQKSRGSAVVLDNSILLGLILDHINDEDGNIVGLVIADVRYLKKKSVFQKMNFIVCCA